MTAETGRRAIRAARPGLSRCYRQTSPDSSAKSEKSSTPDHHPITLGNLGRPAKIPIDSAGFAPQLCLHPERRSSHDFAAKGRRSTTLSAQSPLVGDSQPSGDRDRGWGCMFPFPYRGTAKPTHTRTGNPARRDPPRPPAPSGPGSCFPKASQVEPCQQHRSGPVLPFYGT